MEPKTNYTVVGVIVLVLAAGLLSSLLWLSVGFERKTYNTYLVYISESVHGLNEESSVKFNGVKVGMVSRIQLDKVNPQKIKLILKIEDGVAITTSTHATLITQGITGTTFLGLSASSPTLTPLTKTNDEPYPVIPYKTSFFNQIMENATEITDNLKRVLDKENAVLLKKILTNLQAFSHTIAKNNQNIDQSLRDLPIIMRELKTTVRGVGAMANNMSGASNQVSKAMRAGKDSIDEIRQQTLPSAATLMQRLDVIAGNLEQVSAMMRQNPAVIVRGASPPPPGPGE